MPVGASPARGPGGRGRTIDRALIAGLWLALLALGLHKLFAWDVWWQIGAGRWIAEHGIPAVDPFSYAFPGREWIEPRWLWCLLVGAVFDGLGANFLILLQLALLAATFAVLRASGRGQPGWAVATGLALALAAGHERFMVRPELLSFLALIFVMFAVERYRGGAGAAWLWALPAVQLVWCNAHTLWILGPAALWIAVLAESAWVVAARRGGPAARAGALEPLRLRTLALVAAVVSAVSLVNPYGVRGLLFPFELFREIRAGHVFSETIAEFRGPFSSALFGADPRTLSYLAAIALSAAAFAWNRRRVPPTRLAWWAAFLFLSVEAQRNVALFALVAGWATIANLGEAARARPGSPAARVVPWLARAAVAAFCATVIPLAATDRLQRWQGSHKRFGFGISEHRFPARALAFVRATGLPAPVLHALGDGGYVLFEGGPGSVYTDGRLEVYGAEILEQTFRVTWSGEGLEREADRTGVRTVVVRNEADYGALIEHLEQSPEWVAVYFDPLHLVYLRRSEQTRELVARWAVDWSEPVRRPVTLPPAVDVPDWLGGLWPRPAEAFDDERLGSLFAAVGSYERALERFEAAHRIDAREARTRWFLAQFRLAQGREVEAADLLRGLPRAFEDDPAAAVLSGRIAAWGGRPRLAAERFRRARQLGAAEPDVSLALARVALQAGDLADAAAELEALSADHAERAEVWNLLGVLELRRGARATAVEHFERSLALDPRQSEVERVLREIDRAAGASPGG